ncbi:MAG: lyase [Verrucomicrobia bacterium]|nr:lyase [Verrucomicrobiota bacterium]
MWPILSLAQPAPVTITEDAASFTLANGVLTARVLKRNGDLASLQFRGAEMLNDKSGHAGAYWSHDTTGGTDLVTRITIDPATNGGARGEVSVKGISGGKRMGHGPGAAAGGDFPADIEIRYTLNGDDTGIYTSCTFTKQPGYPAAAMTEARFAAKLADTFDWMTVDAKRDQHFPASLKDGDKYIYTTVQFENPVFGWSSTKENIGFWLVNPSVEFLSGGPTKVEFLGHRDTTPVAAPIVFNYWRSSHYGGAAVEVGESEKWVKTIGPFLLYVNIGADRNALKADAFARQKKEAALWPYAWVSGIDFPLKHQRATVSGRLVLNDPLWEGLYAPTQSAASASRGVKPLPQLPRLRVGLTAPAYTSPYVRPPTPPGGKGPQGPTGPRQIDWQTDAKHYQFWAWGETDGRFSVPNVRPGRYTLRAIADGVLGEYAQADIVVEPGKNLDLGQLQWTPVRRGRPLWEVGIPNRNGSEFAGAEKFWVPEKPLEYATRFPHDVNFVIGQSDPAKDWWFQHVPHNEDPSAKSRPFFGITTPGRATPFKISFDLPAAVRGTAVLRVAVAGSNTREVAVSVNGADVGKIDRLPAEGVITRHSIQGLWNEREVTFDARLLKPGANSLVLTVPAGPVNNGVIYDYLRLELDESATP